MEITPALGIGDLLIVKMSQVSNNLDISLININHNIITEFRLEPDRYQKFLLELIKFLFPHSQINLTNNGKHTYYYNSYPIRQVYLGDIVQDGKWKLDLENKYGDYLIFHTKLRLNNQLTSQFLKTEVIELNDFLDNYQTNKTILIVGERYIENNRETRTHQIISLYPNLMRLSKKNRVVDLTEDNLYSGALTFDQFLGDLNLINQAKLNVCFGIGGPLNICQSFSENTM